MSEQTRQVLTIKADRSDCVTATVQGDTPPGLLPLLFAHAQHLDCQDIVVEVTSAAPAPSPIWATQQTREP